MRAPDSPVREDAVSELAYILGLLTEEDFDWVVSNGEPVQLAPGEDAVRAGDPLSPLMLVLEGELESVSEVPGLSGWRLPGDLLGPIALVDGGVAPATATARGPASIFVVPRPELEAKLALDIAFAARFYRALAAIIGARQRAAAHPEQHDAAAVRLAPPQAMEINTYLADGRLRRLLRRADHRDVIALSGADLTIEQVARVAWHAASVCVTEPARERMTQARAVVDRLAAGETPIYGLTTNVGSLKDVRIDDADQPRFQRHILLSHAAGVGPEHDAEVVRAMLLARLNGMARGGAGVQCTVFDALLGMLEAGIHPVVPTRGSIGMSDLVPLAHLSLPLIGEGEVDYGGRRMGGAEAMAAAGIAQPTLGAKDGLALVSANSASVGHGALVIMRAIDLLAVADVAAALSLEALGGHATVLDPTIDTVRPFSGQLTSAQQMRMLLEGSYLWTAPPTLAVQDPISFRSAVQVHGAVLDVLAAVRATLETELNSTGDNPLVLIDRDEIISDGNFHPAGLSIAFDTLGIALAQLTSMSANRVVRLMDPTFTHLPPYLSAHPTLNVGLGVLQKTATALNAEVRLGANPASLDYLPVAGAIEDHATMAVEGVAETARAVDAALHLFAIELLVAAQAIDLRDGVTLGAGTGAAYARIREQAPRMTDDRLLAQDIAVARGVLDDGTLLTAAGEAIGRPLGATVRPRPSGAGSAS
ncbi:MAG: phenylalanine ammonia-lyase [Solirubrobacterales bacterium]|nr:phenylalanine ammonia-lyase [Solirubrobacterales bacterium]